MPRPVRCNSGHATDLLRDRVYRAMLQLEVGKPGASRSLCCALQRAWLASPSTDSSDRLSDWLGNVAPLCLSMLVDRARIEAPDTLRQPQIANPPKERKPRMQIQVTQLDGVRFAISTRNHTVISDQPEDNGGHDTGMTPPELLLASLGSCAAFYAFQYLKTRKLADTGVEVSVTAEKLKQPARMGNFQIEVACPVSLSEEQTQGMLRSVHQCLVHNTLVSQPEISIHLTTKEATPVQ
jgi:putative redox protein